MVFGQSAHTLLANKIDARVTDVTNEQLLLTKNTNGQRRRHPPPLRLRHACFVNFEVCGIKDLLENLLWRIGRIHSLKSPNGDRYRHFTGDMPIFMAPKPVRNNRDSASLQPFGFLDRLPEFEAI